MRVYFSYLAHESSRFSPIPTSIASFSTVREGWPLQGCEGEPMDIDDLSDDFSLLRLSRARGHEVILGPMAVAAPSRPANRETYEYLRGEILAGLRHAMPVDAVLLFLHGAQLADGYDDCEGDLLAHVRALVGPQVPIGVELDLHCNLSDAMVANATALMPCKEYPHSDFAERAAELLDIVEGAASGRLAPFIVSRRVPVIGNFHTTREPMRSFVDSIKALERRDGVLSIGLTHGFGYSDTAEAGAAVLVVGTGDRARCSELAERLAQQWFAMREQIVPPSLSIEDGLQRARSLQGPIVIADTSDNPGGGAAGDSTHLLRAMLERGLDDAVLGMIWDPVAVTQAAKAGVGATLPLRLGGKTDLTSGEPLDLEVTVLAHSTNARQKIFGGSLALGAAVAVETRGIQIVLNTVRQQVVDPACFTQLGLDPWSRKYVVVKSAQHFYQHFAPRARHVLYIDAPGVVTNDYRRLRYRNLRRPIWPLDATPLTRFGVEWR
ncbi:MAG TPA: M81 family metallopeptidase [Steroidobacteraceae bacterium]|nr:M81 family metallopeptidase [Steroidobacteraceae bacterium]